jgi:hypothetical protein
MQLSSCFTAGTHGSLKSYTYPVKKVILEDAVNMVIAKSRNIKREMWILE